MVYLMNSHFFVEENVYQLEDVPRELINKQYFKPTTNSNQYKANVAGISIFDEAIYFFLPKNTQDYLSNEVKKELGKLTFESLLKYRNENRLTSEEKYWLGKDHSNADLVEVVRWLLNDYKNNGIYSQEKKHESNDIRDRIQWNKTIKGHYPLIIDNQIFYPNLISESKRKDPNSLLTLIHNNVISKITNLYGWLFQVDERKKYFEIELSTSQIIQFLKNELNRTTNTRNQVLIKNIISFLINHEMKNRTFDLVTPYFEYVWEDACRVIFDDDINLHKMVGKPYWKFKDDTIKTSNQLPDVLLTIDSNLVIIDAKYYSMDETYKLNVPGWNSVVKQLYYNLSMSLKYENIKNLFLMPDLSSDNQSFSYIGLTSVVDYEEQFGVVYAYRVNTRFVLSSYLKNTSRKNYLHKYL